jgi:DNA-binding beta-propeller fold protein YncE
MTVPGRLLSVWLPLLGLLVACGGGPAIHEPLSFAGNVPLPRDAGTPPALDLLDADPQSSRLYVSHTSQNSLQVFESGSGKLRLTVPGLPGIKASAFIPGSQLVFTSDAAESAVGVVDVSTGTLLWRIPVAASPDAIQYDPVGKLVAVSLPTLKRIALIDPASRTVVGLVDLPGTPELLTADPNRSRLFVAINDKDEVAVVYPDRRSLGPLYRGCDIKAPTGLAFDARQSRLFVASASVVNVIDVLLERCLGAIDSGHSVDQIALDMDRHHLYVPSASSGNLSVIDVGSLKAVGVVRVAPAIKGIAVDSVAHRVFVGVPRAGLIAVYHDP